MRQWQPDGHLSRGLIHLLASNTCQALAFIQGHTVTMMEALCAELNHSPAKVQYKWSKANWNV